MTGLKKAAGRNLDREGFTCEYTPNGDDFFSVTLLRAGGQNDKFNKLFEQRTRTLRRSGADLSHIDPKRQREITADIYADSVVIGWDEAKFECPCTPDNVRQAFADDPEFLEFCIKQAQQSSNFRDKAREAEAGN